MRFSFSIDQKSIIESKLDLDIIDFSIMRVLADFALSGRCKTMHENDLTWYYLHWKLVPEQIPILGIKSRRGVLKRIHKLKDCNVLIAHSSNQKRNHSWFRLGSGYDLLTFGRVNNNAQVNKQTKERVNERAPDLRTNVHTCVNESAHNNTISNKTINNNTITSLKQKQILQNEPISENVSDQNPISKNEEDAEKEKVAPKRKFKMTRHGNDYPSVDELLDQTMNKVGGDLFEPKGKHELWLTDFFEKNNTEYLQVFKIQPTNDQLAKVISRIGEQGLIQVLRKIEEYCIENPSYTKKRKELSRIITTFSKDCDKSSVTALKSIFNIEYQKRFKEQYEGKRTYTRHIESILSNIESALDLKYSDSTKLKIEAEFKKVLSKLPEKYNCPTQFKIEFISSNFQELRLHCKNGVVEKGSKRGDVSQAYKGDVKW